MQAILTERLTDLTRILKNHKVQRAYAVGSVVSDNFTHSSDIDLLVKFEDGMQPEDYSDNYFDLLFSLQLLFGRGIDLISESNLKNPYLIKSLNSTKQAIYE